MASAKLSQLPAQLMRDLRALSEIEYAGKRSLLRRVRTALANDSYAILVLNRLREVARSYHVPLANRVLRGMQTTLYGLEVGKAVLLGDGVYFVHPLGTVLGGDAQIGARVRFMGNNTIGTAKDNGYPIIEDDVVIGAGARILGPIRIGARSVIGANAVVLSDVPADSVAVGIPAKAQPSNLLPFQRPDGEQSTSAKD